MKEIDRILFVTLNVEKNMYYVLNDQNFVEKFFAISDEKAKEIFHSKYGVGWKSK